VDGIDASLGLTISLTLLQGYRQSGILHASLPRAPGIRGQCRAYIHLAQGQVTQCYLEDQQGQRYPAQKEQLCQLDDERGPYEWNFIPHVPARSSTGRAIAAAIPIRRVAHLYLDHSWSDEQKRLLYHTWEAINNTRTVEEIQALLPVQPSLVETALQTLVNLQAITLITY
jgi:hypothetical protein